MKTKNLIIVLVLFLTITITTIVNAVEAYEPVELKLTSSTDKVTVGVAKKVSIEVKTKAGYVDLGEPGTNAYIQFDFTKVSDMNGTNEQTMENGADYYTVTSNDFYNFNGKVTEAFYKEAVTETSTKFNFDITFKKPGFYKLNVVALQETLGEEDYTVRKSVIIEVQANFDNVFSSKYKIDFKPNEAIEKYDLVCNQLTDFAKKDLKNAGIDITNYNVRALLHEYELGKGSLTVTQQDTNKILVNKTFDIEYLGSSAFNKEDEAYVKNKIANISFNRWVAYEINDKKWTTNNTSYDFASLTGDSKITCVYVAAKGDGNPISFMNGGTINFFMNNVYYASKEGEIHYKYMVTIPSNIADTDKAYIDYATPLVDKWLKKEFSNNEDVKISQNSKVTIAKGAEDFSGYDFEVKVGGVSVGYIILKKANVINTVEIMDGISINATIANNVKITATLLEKTTETFKNMEKGINDKGFKNIVGSFEIELPEGATLPEPLELIFYVGKEHDGKEFIVSHMKKSGEIEEFTGIVKDGKITIIVTELSPFVVAVGDTVIENELDNEPKTGVLDRTIIMAYIALISLCGLVAIRFKK